ncbi:mechanosensitive ion channel [Aurantiacibacter poecillastricola]|uniref:mechanosensitive ion channel n=1 Tax=Aurantiacibacter poecillastricola TaxID=3064385 RepID=UPI00273EB448|nr:mechanosensitive ion channel [Aurantiacibacter sp. 219JJ12-13]MDP5261087.1 mechanosensitive ion channel [Aurantiacibacter sp. 219JJ12-13]
MSFGNRQFDPNLAMDILERIGLALVILLVTWLLAKAAKWAFAKLVDNVGFLKHHTTSGESLGYQLGRIVSLLIWLLGLLAILQVFNLGGVMQPVTTLLDDIMDFIPNLIGAALIFFIGLMVAKIVRDLTVTALDTVDFDKWVNRGGAETLTGNSRLSKTIGTILYAIIVIFVSIMALEALSLESVSEPASDMLALILEAIPRIIGAALLLGIGYLVSRFVVQLIKEVLPGLGVDRALSSSGVLPTGTSASSIIARVVQVAIILFFAIAATRLLGFPELTAILDAVLELGGRVVFGAVVIVAGFFIARLLARLIGGAGESGMASSIVKWATIIIFTFMGLSYTGVGDIITETAFSALVIGMAVAGALAFGLGGREWAGRKLEEWDDKAKSASTTTPTSTSPEPDTGEDPLPPGA